MKEHSISSIHENEWTLTLIVMLKQFKTVQEEIFVFTELKKSKTCFCVSISTKYPLTIGFKTFYILLWWQNYNYNSVF